MIAEAKENSSATIEKHKQDTDAIAEQLRLLEDQIKVQIEKATGFTLFHSFQKRQFDISHSKQYWVYAILILVITSLAFTAYVVHSVQSINDLRFAFFVKLSFSVPLIYAIAFCTVQYSRERRLEEEYAFKSNISISLNPYQELVRKLVDEKNPEEMAKYTAFIIESIAKVYTSPTERVFETAEKPRGLTDKALKQLMQFLEPLVKALAHK